MRRNVLTCIENSALAVRLSKLNHVGISFISITGYEVPQIKGNVNSYIVKEQKKAALEVLSLICSGDSSALQVVANQKETVEKIKS